MDHIVSLDFTSGGAFIVCSCNPSESIGWRSRSVTLDELAKLADEHIRAAERACPHCDGSGIRQFDSDGYEACRCLLPAVSQVPGQQREAVARFLADVQYGPRLAHEDEWFDRLIPEGQERFRAKADELLALLAATRAIYG